MNQFNKLVSGNIPVLVDFYATWCGPCKMMHPVLEELKRKVGDKARIVKIDVDKFSSIASALQIQSVPTLMIYKNGVQYWRHSGAVPCSVLENELKKLF